MYEADGVSYYKVSIAHGVWLIEGAVADVCEEYGYKAVCFGDSGSKWNSDRCKVTLGFRTFNWISKLICNGSDGHKCSKMNNMFAYMNNWKNSECGNVDGHRCTQGNKYVSSPEHQYYAFCVQ